MSEELTTAVTSVTLSVLKALVKLLLEARIGYGETRALVKLAYVLGACEQTRGRGDSSRPNVARISTVTGLSRTEVASLLAQAPDRIPPVKRGRPRAQAVLSGWFSDEDFAHPKSGRPAVLFLTRGRHSFRELVRRYSGDPAATYAPILEELIAARAVERVGEDAVRAVRQTCTNVGWSLKNIAGIADVALHLQALVQNLQHPDQPNYVRSLHFDDLDAEEARVVLPEIKEAADDFVESATITLHQARRAPTSKRAKHDTRNVAILVQVLHDPHLIGQTGADTAGAPLKSAPTASRRRTSRARSSA
jgi:hypothetical protein